MTRSTVFVLSLALWLLVLSAEWAVGISWTFHPDAARYLDGYAAVTEGGLTTLPNNLYYFVSAALGGHGVALVLLNGVLYAVTNVLLWDAYRSEGVVRGPSMVVALFLVLADGYRVHLAAHPLKDTLVVFLAVVLLTLRRGRVVSLVLMLVTRLGSLLYLVAALSRRWAILIGVGGLVVLLTIPEVGDLVQERNVADMGGRGFDTVPDFSGSGLGGAMLRGLVWPALLLSGAFAVVSPTPFFAPIAAYYLGQRLVAMRIRATIGVTAGTLVSLAALAVIVNTFTSFLRYAMPVTSLSVLLAVRQYRSTAGGDGEVLPAPTRMGSVAIDRPATELGG